MKKWKNRKFDDVSAKQKRHQTQLLSRIFIKIKRWIQRAQPFWLIPSGKASKWRCEKLCHRIPGRFFAKTKKCWRQHNMGAIMDFLFQFVNINTIYLSAKFGGDWVMSGLNRWLTIPPPRDISLNSEIPGVCENPTRPGGGMVNHRFDTDLNHTL